MCDVCDSGQSGTSRRQVLHTMAVAPFLIPALRRSPRSAAVEPVPVGSDLDIFPRAAWADERHTPKAAIATEDVRFLIVHHTATSNRYEADDVPAKVQAFRSRQTAVTTTTSAAPVATTTTSPAPNTPAVTLSPNPPQAPLTASQQRGLGLAEYLAGTAVVVGAIGSFVGAVLLRRQRRADAPKRPEQPLP